jgi:hypothetical protein
VLLLLIAWLYGSILAHLFLQWLSDKDFSHGIFVPIFALYVIWQDRERLTTIAPAPSWAGLPLVVLSMVVLALGILSADIFFPRLSLLILLAGLIILFQGGKFFRAVLFPWALLILMIPIPALIMNRFTFPLQLLAAKLSAALLELVGVVVLLGGNIFTLACWPAAGRRGSMQRNPLSSNAGHAGHHLRVSLGNSDMGAGRVGMPDGANRSGG